MPELSNCEHDWSVVEEKFWSCSKCLLKRDYDPIYEAALRAWAKRMVAKYGFTKTNVGEGD